MPLSVSKGQVCSTTTNLFFFWKKSSMSGRLALISSNITTGGSQRSFTWLFLRMWGIPFFGFGEIIRFRENKVAMIGEGASSCRFLYKVNLCWSHALRIWSTLSSSALQSQQTGLPAPSRLWQNISQSLMSHIVLQVPPSHCSAKGNRQLSSLNSSSKILGFLHSYPLEDAIPAFITDIYQSITCLRYSIFHVFSPAPNYWALKVHLLFEHDKCLTRTTVPLLPFPVFSGS